MSQDFFAAVEEYGYRPTLQSPQAVQPPPKPGRLYRFLERELAYPLHPQPHVEICQIIEDVLGDCRFDSGGQKMVMIGVPRGSWKTSIGAQGTPIYVLDNNVNARILIDSRRHDISKRRLAASKRLMAAHERFAAWRPEFRSDTWNSDSIFISARTDHHLIDPSIATAGIDRSMTGGHFDVIIDDDLVNDKNIDTVEARDIVYNHILDQFPILATNGVLILLFTTWHTDDAYARLMKADAERERAGDDPLFGEKLIRSAINPDRSLYFPGVLTHEFLDKARAKMGSRKYSSQYLLKPVADEDKTFAMELARIESFSFFTTSERETGGLIRWGRSQIDVETTLAWDPAGRRATRVSDEHGLTVVGTDDEDRWWIIEALGEKGTPTVIIDRVCRLIAAYRPWRVSVEDAFGSGLWIDLLAKELARRRLAAHIVEYSTGGVRKESRVELVQPRWEDGSIILRADPATPNATVYPKLWNQFDGFTPAGGLDHDDIIDTLPQHMTITRRPSTVTALQSDPNPRDPEFDRWRSLIEAAKPAAARSRAGLFGPTWKA